jgi:hypothetical protein
MNKQERFALVLFGLFVTIFKELIEVKDTHCKFDFLGVAIVGAVLIAIAVLLPNKKHP